MPTTLKDLSVLGTPVLADRFDLLGVRGLNPACVMEVDIDKSTMSVTYLLTEGDTLPGLDSEPSSGTLVFYDFAMQASVTVQLDDVVYRGFSLRASSERSTVLALTAYFEARASLCDGTPVAKLIANGAFSKIIDIVYECGSVKFVPMSTVI